MSNEFLAEVVEMSRKVRSGNTYTTMSGEPHLPDQAASLYGADAGDDYARTVIDAVKAAIKDNAECRKLELVVRIPNSGKAAQAAMAQAFRDLLGDFDVTTSAYRLTVSWKKHFNT